MSSSATDQAVKRSVLSLKTREKQSFNVNFYDIPYMSNIALKFAKITTNEKKKR